MQKLFTSSTIGITLVLLTYVAKAQGTTAAFGNQQSRIEILVNNQPVSTKGGFCVVMSSDRVKISIYNINATDLDNVIIHTCKSTQNSEQQQGQQQVTGNINLYLRKIANVFSVKTERMKTQKINNKLQAIVNNNVVLIEFDVTQVSNCDNRYFSITLDLNNRSKIPSLKKELRFFLLK